MLTILSYIFTFGVLLSFFVIAMFILIDRLYPAEEAITDALYKKQVNDYYQQRINPLHDDKSVLGFGSPPVGDALDDNLIEDIDEEWIDYHDVVKK